MALTVTTQFPPPPNAAPYAIDRDWCIGDSLGIINANAGYFDTKINTLESLINLKEDEFTILPVLSGGTGAATPILARQNLGLGPLATLNTITNAQVANGAAIQGSKIVPNFGNQTISTTAPLACQYVNAPTETSYFGATWTNATSFFDGDRVRIGREAGIANSGSITFLNAYDGSRPYLGGFRWNDSFFTAQVRSGITVSNDFRVPGTLNAAAITTGAIYGTSASAQIKSFLINHPVRENYKLKHFCVESSNTDLLYRGKVVLNNGQAIVNIDQSCDMTPGTVNALSYNLVVTSLQNQTGFGRLKPTSIVNGEFTIICEDNTSNDEIVWVVMGERKDLIDQEIEIPN